MTPPKTVKKKVIRAWALIKKGRIVIWNPGLSHDLAIVTTRKEAIDAFNDHETEPDGFVQVEIHILPTTEGRLK